MFGFVNNSFHAHYFGGSTNILCVVWLQLFAKYVLYLIDYSCQIALSSFQIIELHSCQIARFVSHTIVTL